MTKLVIRLRNGESREIQADQATTVMEAIRNAGIDEIAALCGGCCSCATCHVILADEAFAALGAIPDDESDLLDSSSYREATSRLSCQITVGNMPEGSAITIAPEE
ncbi:MAG: 2Fe-2S iron-sulfur cluster-binding protein [Novosphingobium sp.]